MGFLTQILASESRGFSVTNSGIGSKGVLGFLSPALGSEGFFGVGASFFHTEL